jgi:hypothetical protein
MDVETLNLLLALALEHKWLAASTILIGLVVRLLKSPRVPWPFDQIPPKARPLVAIVLGALSSAIEHVVQGTPWKEALASGLFSAALAVLGHQVVIEWLRGGREVFAPQAAPAPALAPEPPPPPVDPPAVSEAEVTPITLRGGELPPFPAPGAVPPSGPGGAS